MTDPKPPNGSAVDITRIYRAEPDDPFGDSLAPDVPAVVPIPILTADELRGVAQSVRWLVKHIVPADSIGMLFGASGTFKSFIALDMALHVAHGMPWLGKKTQRGPVLYVAAEGGAGLWRRVEAWHRSARRAWADAEFLVCPVALDLGANAAQLAESLALKAPECKPALIVVDTMSQTFSGEENSAQETAAYMRSLGASLRAVWGCAVLVIHHSGHSATERPRGSSALRANCDFLMGVHRDEKEMLATMSCSKQKDGEAFADQTFALTVHELGRDEDDEPVTSLVARAVLSDEERTELVAHEAAKGRSGRNATILALAQTGMHEDELRKAFYETIDGDSDARRQAYGRARGWACKAGMLEIVEGRVLVTKR